MPSTAKLRLEKNVLVTSERVRHAGGGRKRLVTVDPGADQTVERIMDEYAACDLMSLLRWTNKFVLDGAGWHRARDLRIPENMRLLPLPPYSPELNPVEHLWEEIREKWFPNLVFDTLTGVADRLVEALAALENNPHRVAQITGFDWIVSIPMNAT